MNGTCSYLDWHDLTKLFLSNRTLQCMQAPQWQQLEGALHFLQAFAYRKQLLADLLSHWLDTLAMVLPLFTPWSCTSLQIWGRMVRMLSKVNLEGGTSEKSLRQTFQRRLDRRYTYGGVFYFNCPSNSMSTYGNLAFNIAEKPATSVE